jgi:hypothetical protein
MGRTTNKLKVIIAGSREFTDKKMLFNKAGWWYGTLPNTPEIIVVSGGARGADELGESWAEYMQFMKLQYPVTADDWDRHGKKAGILRNVEMAKIGDVLLAFWDGQSKGTKHMIDEALRRGMEVHVWQVDIKPKQKPRQVRGI